MKADAARSSLDVRGLQKSYGRRQVVKDVSLRVAQRLEAATAAQLRVVVVHQPVAVIRASDRVNLLRGHTAALERWAAAGADLVLGGHIHLPYVLALPALARPLWAVQAGTAVSARVREGLPNSVNLLRWGAHAPPGCCLIEQWDYAAGQQAFVRALVTEVLSLIHI